MADSGRLRFGSVNEVFVVSCEKCHKIQPLMAYTRDGAIHEAEKLPEWSRQLDKFICDPCRKQPTARP